MIGSDVRTQTTSFVVVVLQVFRDAPFWITAGDGPVIGIEMHQFLWREKTGWCRVHPANRFANEG